jgi:hypothetical protein
MKTTFILFSALILISGCIFSQKNDCSSFKKGKFELVDEQHSLHYLVERDDSIQTETNVKTGQISSFKIKWLNKCEYQLEMISGSNQAMEFYKGKKLIVNIVETYPDGYKFSTQLEGDERIRYQTLRRVNK